MSWLFVVLSLLFLKHWIIDFELETTTGRLRPLNGELPAQYLRKLGR